MIAANSKIKYENLFKHINKAKNLIMNSIVKLLKVHKLLKTII